ncbi:hypothetical protein DIE23_37945 [Burkholderia sp. Bp9143]|uniref:hypothetical protein n=1 Tax=Burkholderia sp. Bp9143 TaxID=2184574 RepID=UPI000F58F762|nr:hypothetical protein [Burkholderia sp. Bp9143]RQR21643.1 hypothetical protein DIE23_37945 [Burkholderia sp. Bp9143]
MKKTVFKLALASAAVFAQRALADVVLDVHAPGCVAKDPKGKPLVFAGNPGDTIRVPRGTSFNDACLADLSLSKDVHILTDSIAKWQVRSEVEKREHVRGANVQIVAPGVAKATFHGGSSIVRFGFRDIDHDMSNCPVGQDSECEKRFQDNPSGFEVLSYEKHRV